MTRPLHLLARWLLAAALALLPMYHPTVLSWLRPFYSTAIAGELTDNLGLTLMDFGELRWDQSYNASMNLIDDYMCRKDQSCTITGNWGLTATNSVHVYNVESYGADGTDGTDDTSAIYAAIQAAESDCGVVYFPPGKFIVTNGMSCATPEGAKCTGDGTTACSSDADCSGIGDGTCLSQSAGICLIDSCVSIFGAGGMPETSGSSYVSWQSLIKSSGDMPVIRYTLSTRPHANDKSKGVFLRDISIEGSNSSSDVHQDGVHVDNKGITMSNVTIGWVGRHGLYVTHSVGGVYDNIIVHRNKSDGVFISDVTSYSSGGNCNFNRFSGSAIGNVGHGVEAQHGAGQEYFWAWGNENNEGKGFWLRGDGGVRPSIGWIIFARDEGNYKICDNASAESGQHCDDDSDCTGGDCIDGYGGSIHFDSGSRYNYANFSHLTSGQPRDDGMSNEVDFGDHRRYCVGGGNNRLDCSDDTDCSGGYCMPIVRFDGWAHAGFNREYEYFMPSGLKCTNTDDDCTDDSDCTGGETCTKWALSVAGTGGWVHTRLDRSITQSDISGLPEGGMLLLQIEQPAAAHYTWTWPSNFDCYSGQCPQVSQIDGSTDNFLFFREGANVKLLTANQRQGIVCINGARCIYGTNQAGTDVEDLIQLNTSDQVSLGSGKVLIYRSGGVLYVDIHDADGSAESRVRLLKNDGTTAGQIVLNEVGSSMKIETASGYDVVLAPGGGTALTCDATDQSTVASQALTGKSLQAGFDTQDGRITVYSEDGATDHSIHFDPPTAGLATDVTYKLPSDDGDAGEQLVTDGSGVLSWGVGVNGVGAYPPVSCDAGTIFIDTDETDDSVIATTNDNSLLLCVATDTWVVLENN